MAASTLFRARVPTERLKRAEEIFARLGMKPSDAFNIFLAQVELRNDMPFVVTTNVNRLLTTEEQAKTWENAWVSTEAHPGEIWIVNFGLAAKERPVLIPTSSRKKQSGEEWTESLESDSKNRCKEVL